MAELRKSSTARINTLHSRIGELEGNLKLNKLDEEEDDTEEVDIDKLIAEKIDKINLPRMIQKELEELAEPGDGEIDQLVKARIDKINFSLLIQRELAKSDSCLQADDTLSSLKTLVD